MPPLKLHPEAYRSNPSENDFAVLEEKFRIGDLKRIDLDSNFLYYSPDSDIGEVIPAYVFETGQDVYITSADGGETFHSPDVLKRQNGPRQIKPKNWLRTLLHF